jgi:hypothetical protein
MKFVFEFPLFPIFKKQNPIFLFFKNPINDIYSYQCIFFVVFLGILPSFGDLMEHIL